ncbi:phosphatase PAP2 family protein [Cupriavidus sp. TMH.W2]|uniref:phosphatase PAP2 family protein n=1 Tax=Cupriavidus sp. TMH.W2 TaxID=3434465 RepID=UPI003D7818ED
MNELAMPGNSALLSALAHRLGPIDLTVLRVTFALFDPRAFAAQAVVCALWRDRQRRSQRRPDRYGTMGTELILSGLCFVATVGAVGVTKLVVSAPRPALLLADISPRLPAGDPYAFPSGHAAMAAAIVFLLWARARVLGRTLLLLILGWVMAARCIAGLHFPLDVVAGAAIAFVCCAGVRWQAERRLSAGKPQA